MSGLFSQLGVVDESTYGTAVAVTKFVEFNNESIDGKYERIESSALRTNTRVLRGDRFQVNPKGAEGGFEFDVLSKNFAYFLKHMLGTVASPFALTGADTGTYVHVGSVGTLTAKSLTVQVGRPQTGGTVTPFTYTGGKVKSWELSNSVDGFLVAKLDMDFQAEASSGASAYTLQTAAFPTGTEVLNFVGGTVAVGGLLVTNRVLTTNVVTLTTTSAHGLSVGDVVTVVGVHASMDGTYVVATVPTGTTFTYAKTAADVVTAAAPSNSYIVGATVAASNIDVTNATVSVDNGLKTDRYFIRSSTLKKEPLEAGMRDIKFSVDMEFDSLTQYNRVASATNAGALATLQLKWVGSVATSGGAVKNAVTVHIPLARFDEAAPQVDGADLLNLTLTGKGLDPSSIALGTVSPIVVAVTSAEATP